MSSPALAVETRPSVSPEQRRAARRCLSVLAVLGTCGLVGVASSLYLVNHLPLLLIALSPIGRHLILVAPIVNPWAFVGVAVTRRLLFYGASFGLGRSLGPAGVTWVETRYARAGRLIRWLEGWFARAARSVVFLFPGPTVSVLAGSSGMSPRVFAPLVTAGLVLRMLVVLGLAEWLREPILGLLAWIDRHWVPGTVLLVTGILVYHWRRRRASRRASLA